MPLITTQVRPHLVMLFSDLEHVETNFAQDRALLLNPKFPQAPQNRYRHLAMPQSVAECNGARVLACPGNK
jgi:hypothetical protein